MHIISILGCICIGASRFERSPSDRAPTAPARTTEERPPDPRRYVHLGTSPLSPTHAQTYEHSACRPAPTHVSAKPTQPRAHDARRAQVPRRLPRHRVAVSRRGQAARRRPHIMPNFMLHPASLASHTLPHTRMLLENIYVYSTGMEEHYEGAYCMRPRALLGLRRR